VTPLLSTVVKLH